MLSDTSTVVVGVSGGADSVALLHFLNTISDKYKIKVIAAHVNHQLRGRESDRDEEFVCSICEKFGIKLFIKRENVKKRAFALRQGLEECGRTVRYSYFNELAYEADAKIATAHTLSDSIETSIMNLTRGSGINGLCGIPPVRGKIIRPFIDLSRDEVEEYCKRNSLEFINDSTNFSRKYTRNRIRMDVVPVLKGINPNLEDTFRRFFINIYEDNNYLNDLCQKELQIIKNKEGFVVEKLKTLYTPIKKRVLLAILKEFLNRPPESKDVDNLIKVLNGEIKCISIDKEKNIIIKDGNLSINCLKRKNQTPTLWEYKAQNINILTEAKKTFIIDILNSKEYIKITEINTNALINAVSLDNIDKANLVFRNRRPGDVFSPRNRGITKKIKKLFNEVKVPLDLRENVPILSYKKEILWIYGLGASEKYKVDEHTNLVAIISERKTESRDV